LYNAALPGITWALLCIRILESRGLRIRKRGLLGLLLAAMDAKCTQLKLQKAHTLFPPEWNMVYGFGIHGVTVKLFAQVALN